MFSQFAINGYIMNVKELYTKSIGETGDLIGRYNGIRTGTSKIYVS